MRYYLYLHIRPDKNQIFYVGIGTKKKNHGKTLKAEYSRAYAFSKGCRTGRWRNVYNLCKKKIKVEIVCEGKTIKEIKKKEIELIAFYGREDLGKGTLVNFTDGGDGTEGWVPTEKTKKAIGDANRGRKHTEETIALMSEVHKGIKFTEEHKKKIGDRHRGKTVSAATRKKLSKKSKGRKHTKKAKLKMSESRRGAKNYAAVSIVQYSLSREFIKEWECIMDVTRELGISNTSISACCRHRPQKKSAGGYVWEYKNKTN